MGEPPDRQLHRYPARERLGHPRSAVSSTLPTCLVDRSECVGPISLLWLGDPVRRVPGGGVDERFVQRLAAGANPPVRPSRNRPRDECPGVPPVVRDRARRVPRGLLRGATEGRYAENDLPQEQDSFAFG